MKTLVFARKLALTLLMLVICGIDIPAIANTIPQNNSRTTTIKKNNNGTSLPQKPQKRRKRRKLASFPASPGSTGQVAAVRGVGTCKSENASIIALSPGSMNSSQVKKSKNNLQYSMGLIDSAYPTILLYAPKISSGTLVFTLQKIDQSQSSDNFLYSMKIEIPQQYQGKDGILVLNTANIINNKENLKNSRNLRRDPAKLPKLEFGKLYNWKVEYDSGTKESICDLIQRVDTTKPMADQLDKSQMEFIKLEDQGRNIIANQLNESQKTDYPDIYSENSIWYSSLSSIAELLKNNPQDTTLLQTWQDLLPQDLPNIPKTPKFYELIKLTELRFQNN